MSKKELFESIYRLTEQLKGGPLKTFEKQHIMDDFHNTTGTTFDRANKAIANALHTDPSFISERANALEYVDRLRQDLKKSADAWEP